MKIPAELLSTLLIGLSLSMDAFAVSVSSGIAIPGLKPFYMLRASFFFGLFQFLMPVAGWFVGGGLAAYIGPFDHWVVFILLAFIGGKMILESLRGEKNKKAGSEGAGPGGAGDENAGPEGAGRGGIRSLWTLLSVSLATSIDALAVGVSFSLLDQGIWLNALIIGVVTFSCCLFGFEFGRRLGRLFEKWAALAGGLVLIGVGAKILIEHLAAGK